MASNTLRKLLFFDDAGLSDTSLCREFHQPEKHQASPIIVPDRPWEGQAAFVDTGIVIRDQELGRFRCWYQAGLCGDVGDGTCMCYAESADGVEWTKPTLGLIEYEGSTDNNILLRENAMMHDPAILIDPTDPDPARRYKCIWWGGEAGKLPSQARLGHCVAYSPDGIRWTPDTGNPVWPAHPEIANPIDIIHRGGDYYLTCSVGGRGMRVVGITRSQNFTNFDLPEIIFESGRDDPFGTEYSGLSLVDAGGVYVGMLWVVLRPLVTSRAMWDGIVAQGRLEGRFAPEISMNSGRAGKWTIHTELVYGPDPWHLVRAMPGKPFIPMGGEGSWDECLILGARPMVTGGKIWIYYIGQGRQDNLPGENRPVQEWPQATGLCTLREDGYVSLGGRGFFTTTPITVSSKLAVNADAAGGEVTVRLLDEEGRVLPGFDFGDCIPIRRDTICAPLLWREAQVEELGKRKVRLHVQVRDARVYSLSWRA